jgi:hypothetical protein
MRLPLRLCRRIRRAPDITLEFTPSRGLLFAWRGRLRLRRDAIWGYVLARGSRQVVVVMSAYVLRSAV